MKNDVVEYSELLKQYGNEYIPYSIKLESVEWQEKRAKIISRDGSKCTCCGERATFPHHDGEKWVHVATWSEFKKECVESVDENGRYELLEYEEEMPFSSTSNAPTILQVHHRYYIKGRLPWEYKSDALQTLCAECHQKLHNAERIKVYEAVEGIMIELECQPCSRCNGAGYFPQYKKVNNGRCFKCEGARYTGIIL
jgi:hypothetical protein